MDGGKKHLDQLDGWGAAPHRANRSRVAQALSMAAAVQERLDAALRAAVPSARLVRPQQQRSIDADWFRMAHAPLLVTAAGSFAVSAAIASHARHVRTPAAANLNFPNREGRREEALADNWRTYAYDLKKMEG